MQVKLYQCFEHWTRGGSIFLYSDPHFNDEEMKYLRKDYIGDDEQVKRINSVVGRNDTLIILGDIGDTSFVTKLRGYKVLIKGNHDTGVSNYKRRRYTKNIPVDDELVRGLGQTDERTICRELSSILKADSAFAGVTGPWHKNWDERVSFDYYMASYDDHLFDEVYEGTLQISPKIMLSHEPIEYAYCYNLHGHDHSRWFTEDSMHRNLCAEHINYTPVPLTEIIKSGVLKDIPDIHRVTIDKCSQKKED